MCSQAKDVRREVSDLSNHIRSASHPPIHRSLIYGAPGVGKTVLGVSIGLALGERLLYIPTEPGDESLADWPELRARTTTLEYGGINMLGELVTAYRDGEFSDHPSIMIDTFDELVEIMLDDLVTGYKPSKDTRPVAEPRAGTGLRRIEVAGTDDYRFLRDGLRPAIRDLCRLPVNLILTSHVREPTWADENKKKMLGTPLPPMRPDLPAQTFKLISKNVGLMGHMTRRGEKRTVSFRTDTNKEEAKSRIKELDNQIINADTLPAIIKQWSMKNGI